MALGGILAAAVLFSAGLEDQPDLAEYKAEAARAGRDADSQVQLALWCEARGLEPERLKHLARAVLINPNHVLARALLGLVREQDRWRRPEEVTRATAGDPVSSELRAEYEAKRREAPLTVDGRWKLAVWCEENGLQPESRAHFGEVIRLDPNHEKARHRLGFKRVGRVWATDAQVSTSRAETEAQERANRKYRPTFERWAAGLNDSEGTKRSEAQSRFLEISDPRAIPELKRVLGRDDPRRLRMLAATLGQIDSPWAARTLVEMALGGNDSEARRMAVETLRQRDYREFIDRLIGLVRKPLTYDVRFVGGPGTTGVLYVEGEEYNLRKRYEIGITNLPRPRIGQLAPGEAVVFDESGTPHAIRPQGGIAVTEDLARSVGFSRGSSYIDNLTAALYLSQALAGQSAESWLFSGTGGYGFVGELGGAPPRTVARPLVTPPELSPEIARRVAVAEQGIRNVQAQQAADIAEIDALNQDIQATNDRVLPILTSITGLELGAEPRQWQDWYFDQIGVSSHRPSEKPTIDQVVRYQPPRLSSSCFGAGTLVQTKLGPRAIETLAVGDLVLSQDPQAGSIEYQPVLAVYHNPPSKTFRVKLDSGETIVSSTFHRFWVANRGWVMAKDLHEGDTLRTLGGRTKVVSIEPGEVMPVYNLDVSRTRSFFVGKSIALVHDHSIPSGSTPNPFDALGGLASASGGARTRTRSD